MKRGFLAITLLWLSFLCSQAFAFPSDAIRVDKDIVNVNRIQELVEYDPFFYKTLSARSEIVRLTLKNYYLESTDFNLTIEMRYVSGDLMVDSCPEKESSFCFPDEAVVISFPKSRTVGGQDFSQILIEFTVSDEAIPSRYYLTFRAYAQEEEYASQDIILNIGKENFPFGKDGEEEVNRFLPVLVFFAFLLAMLVFGLVLISKGRGY